MASKWTEVPLEQLKAQTKSAFAMGPFGSKIKAENFRSAGVPVIKGGNLNSTYLDESTFDFLTKEKADELESAKARRLDIVITHRGTLGQVGLIPEDSRYEEYVVSQSQLKMSFDFAKVDPYFVYYFLKSPLGQSRLLSNASQVGVPAIAQALTSVRAIEIPLPPDRVEQGHISKILRDLDQKIALNLQINQTLEAIAQAIFQSWFVDFDPVKAKIAAKAEGRDPLRAAMSAISGKADAEVDALPPEQYEQLAASAALFPDEMEASNLGQIPKGWAINQISQFGDVVCGKTPSKTNPHFFGEGIPFIKIPDMHNNVYVVSPLEQLSASGAASQVKKTIPPGSICVSCIATVGKVVIAHEPSQTNQQINSIVPRHPQYTTYLYFQMRAKDKEFHDLASGGSATLNMNTSTFSKVSVLNPAFNVLEKFSVNVEPLFSEILVRQKQSALLSEARDTLLPKLLSGELSVADAMVEAVA